MDGIMERPSVNVDAIQERHLEHLIIVEAGDNSENTVLGGETCGSGEDDDQQHGQVGTTISGPEEDGENVKVEQMSEERNQLEREIIAEECENRTLEQPGGIRPEETGTKEERDETESNVCKTGREAEIRGGIEMKEMTVEVEERAGDSELHWATPTTQQVLQEGEDTNGLISPDQTPTMRTGLVVNAEKQARRLTSDFPDTLYELLCTLQEGRRLNDQRCSFRREGRRRCHSEPSITRPANRAIFSSMSSLQKEEFFELVATSQARRLDDQRAELQKSPPPKPKLTRLRSSLRLSMVKKPPAPPAPIPAPKEDLYTMILTSQAQGRLEEQRSAPPGPMDDEDFFSLLLRVQGGRMDEQRTELPETRHALQI